MTLYSPDATDGGKPEPRLVHSLAEVLERVQNGLCLTIGNFDGVHVGHRHLIAQAALQAGHLNLPCLVMTFWPHPIKVLAPAYSPPLLTGRAKRAELLMQTEADLIFELDFTTETAALNPEEFTRNFMLPLKVRKLVVGYDFSLGKGRSGNFEVLCALGRKYGFTVDQIPAQIVNDAVVSSTRIRDLIRAGDVFAAGELLERSHSVRGEVEPGEQVGRKLGFPTANMVPGEVILPRNGIYATLARVDENVIPAVTNVGIRPTLDGKKLLVETHLLDFSGDLYGRELEISFVARLRDEERFSSLEALQARIRADVAMARDILINNR